MKHYLLLSTALLATATFAGCHTPGKHHRNPVDETYNLGEVQNPHAMILAAGGLNQDTETVPQKGDAANTYDADRPGQNMNMQQHRGEPSLQQSDRPQQQSAETEDVDKQSRKTAEEIERARNRGRLGGDAEQPAGQYR